MHKDYAKELLEVIYNVSEKERKIFFMECIFWELKKNFIELHVYQDV